MKFLIPSILIILLHIGCANKSVTKIQWDGELIKNSDKTNYLHWNDGNQFYSQIKDSLSISLAGFEFENALYILVSISNEKNHPITFYSKNSQINYEFNGEQINILPVRAKNLGESHFSLFNTIVDGAGKISRFFLNIPIDILFNPAKDETNTSDKFGGEYHDEKLNMTKKLFMSNHTLFPGTNYAGFLVFEYDSDKKMDSFIYTLEIDDITQISAKGSFAN